MRVIIINSKRNIHVSVDAFCLINSLICVHREPVFAYNVNEHMSMQYCIMLAVERLSHAML